jgi:sortase A
MARPLEIHRASGSRRARLWRLAEYAAWATGVVCLVVWIGLYLDGVAGRRRAMERFAELQAAARNPSATPDQSLWSPERIAAWRTASNEPAPPPLAILRIPRIRVEVPVLAGTGDFALNRAVGHIEETATPGTDGNSGIAGHRDGFFRGLKDIAPGDAIQLETSSGLDAYRVERTWIVAPEDVSVLDPTSVRSITLVTCYPFYFVGPAPQRFIVRAVLDRPASTSAQR